MKARELLAMLKPDKGDVVEFIIDDSKKQKRGKTMEAAVTHLHLVCFAYALLTHIAIKREGAQGKRKLVARMSTSELQNEVCRMVWADLTEYLKQFSSGDQIVKELERLLIAA